MILSCDCAVQGVEGVRDMLQILKSELEATMAMAGCLIAKSVGITGLDGIGKPF